MSASPTPHARAIRVATLARPHAAMASHSCSRIRACCRWRATPQLGARSQGVDFPSGKSCQRHAHARTATARGNARGSAGKDLRRPATRTAARLAPRRGPIAEACHGTSQAPLRCVPPLASSAPRPHGHGIHASVIAARSSSQAGCQRRTRCRVESPPDAPARPTARRVATACGGAASAGHAAVAVGARACASSACGGMLLPRRPAASLLSIGRRGEEWRRSGRWRRRRCAHEPWRNSDGGDGSIRLAGTGARRRRRSWRR